MIHRSNRWLAGCLCLAATMLSGCATTQEQTSGTRTTSRDKTGKGAGIGAAAGAVLGAVLGEGQADRILAGAAIGAGIGTGVGYIALCFGYSIEFAGRDAFLDEFFVTEPHRGRGIGRRVLGLVIEEAGRLGVRCLHLEVARANHWAQRLYSSAGFESRDRFHLMSRTLQGGPPAASDIDSGGDA